MPEKRVLLILSGQFLGGVISCLLQNSPHIQLIEASPAGGAELLETMREARPDIVVLDDTVKDKYLSNLLVFMQAITDLRVVVVSTESNDLNVYQKQHIQVQQSADLFAVL